jgi:hypothetical protein
MVLLEERVEKEGALCEGNQEDEEADIPSDDCKQLGTTQLLTLHVQMVVGSAVLAVDLLGPHHLRCHTVGMK